MIALLFVLSVKSGIIIDMKPEEQNTIVNLLQENIRISRKIYESVEKTERYMLWIKIINIIKIIVIIIPIILAAIYLPPLFKQVTGSYGDIYDELKKVQSGQADEVDPGFLDRLLP